MTWEVVTTSDTPVDAVDGRSRRREHSADKLYNAADALLATQHFDELSVEDICERAGVGRATFFRIFETKSGLLREFNRRLTRDAAQRIGLAGDIDARTALGLVRDAINDAWQHASTGHLGMARSFLTSIPSSDPHAAHPELLALVTQIVHDGVVRGELSSEVPVDLAASLALINLSAAAAYAVAGRSHDIDELSQVLLEQWYTGMTRLSAY